MSGFSPVRRLKTKTSDISDFFRGGSSSSSSQPLQRQSPSSIDLLQQTLPQQVTEQSASPPKSKRSRIPFLGRSKKKFSHLSGDQSDQASTIAPTDAGATEKKQSSGDKLKDGTVVVINQPDLESSASNSAASTLGSKFAAHFIPAKPRSRLANLNQPVVAADNHPHSLIPPRATSFDSTSTASQDRSPTPRPTRPTITVSVSPPPPEDLQSFNDLFTRPLPSNAQPPVQQKHLHIPKTEQLDSSDDDKVEPLELATPNATPPTSPLMQSHNTVVDASSGRRMSYTTDEGSTSDFSSDHADRHLMMRVLSSKIRPSKKRQIPVSVLTELERNLGTKVDFDSAEEIDFSDSDPKQSKTQNPSNIPWKRQTVATMPFKSSERPTSPRSCLKPSSASGRNIPGPPTIPLPPPPSSPPPFAAPPSLPPVPPPSRRSDSLSRRVTITRPRANTIPSVVPTSSSTVTRSPSVKPKVKDRPPPSEDKSLQDGDNPESLREALRLQRARFDDLAAYLMTVMEKHALEKAVLMKKIDTLEREARKTGRELKGLRYLVMNGTGSGVFNVSSASPPTSNSRSTTPVHSQSSDDGADRHHGSGAETASFNGKNTKRDNRTPDSLSPNVSRPTSLTVPVGDNRFGPGPDFLGSETYLLSTFEKRSSASSFSSFLTSPASSTSSLLLPNLTASSTLLSILSAIPEAGTPLPESRRDPAVAAAILAAERQKEKEEKRASRALRRLSSSSSTSSASGASMAYATNLKRGRPPSIAQVLGVSSSMEDVLEKLRPFATTTKPANM